MSQKAIITVVVGFFLIVLLIGGVYFYISSSQKSTIPTFTLKSFPPTEGGLPLPPIAEEAPKLIEKGGELLKITDDPIIGGTLSRDGRSVVYILRENGNLYRSSFDGKEKTRLSNTTILGIYNAVWSPEKTKVFLSYERNEEIKKIVFDLSSSTTASSIISPSIRSGAWSKDGKVFYLVDQTETGVRLIEANSIGQSGKERIKIPLGDLNILPIQSDSLFFAEAPSGLASGPLFQFNTKTGLFKEISSGHGLTALLSPKGERVLISETNSTGFLQSIKVLTLSSSSETLVSVRTLAEKCAWQNEETVWCGVPQSIPENSIMPDDYYKGSIIVNDELLQINLRKQEVRSYDVKGFDMQDLFVSPDEKNVFFRDQYTDFLYRFALP